jgi:hypothetical protein
MDACLPRFTRPPGSTHPRGGPARCSFMRGLTDRTSYLGRVGAIGFGESLLCAGRHACADTVTLQARARAFCS